jgi:hypothetical protein
MTILETIAQQVQDLNKAYRENKMSRAQYLKDHTKLANKWKRLTKRETLADVMRKAGVKVTKIGKGYYTYKGINFTVDIMEDSCETTWWQVNDWEDNVDPRVLEYFNDWNQYDRKQDVLGALFELDKSLSK